MVNVEDVCKKVLTRLHAMDYEKDRSVSCERLIFPNKSQAKGNRKRISEQELRLLFIEEFKASTSDLRYSIETPTEKKYKFGASLDRIICDKDGQSALVDMCVFERGEQDCRRILNIEFKHKNSAIKNIGKDVLKLICENQNGVFIQLLNNTNRDTLCNNNKTGVFDKLYDSFRFYKGNWSNNDKYIRILILSLKEQVLIYRDIYSSDIHELKSIFFRTTGCARMQRINGENNWKML